MSIVTIKGVRNKVERLGKVLKKSYGPLDALEPSKKDKYTLRYPLDVGESRLYPHTLEFVCWKPKPVGLTDGVLDYNVNDATKAKGGRVDTHDASLSSRYTDMDPNREKSWGATLNEEFNKRGREYGGLKYNQNMSLHNRTSDWTKRASLSDLIVMYIPQQSLIETFNNSYNTKSMTELFGNLGLGLDALTTLSKADNLDDFMKNASPYINKALGKIGEKAGLVNEGVGEALIQAGGYATNPQFEVLYGGSDLREFDMQFKMTPRSQKEADEIQMIIKRFKYHASPEYINNGGRFMVPPSFFDIYIKYNNEENDRIPMKFSTCVLKAISVDMGSGTDQFVTYRDGSPLEIGLNLKFGEMEVMHKALRDEGY